MEEFTELDYEHICIRRTFVVKEISVFFAKVGNSENMKLGEGKKLQFFDKEDLIKLVDNLDYSNIYLKTYKEFVKLLKNQ